MYLNVFKALQASEYTSKVPKVKTAQAFTRKARFSEIKTSVLFCLSSNPSKKLQHW